mmetsp:Transcript_27162/g.65272  ORF Transcript_27162/g.65272 Transcript_27162/m.65272 type:complete len:97 (+) Transcript_27162:137-427(+)
MQSLFSLAAIVALHILSKRDYYTSAVVAFQTPSTIPTRLAAVAPVRDRQQQQQRTPVSTSHRLGGRGRLPRDEAAVAALVVVMAASAADAIAASGD